MHHGAYGDLLDGQAVADFDIGLGAGIKHVADLQAQRSDDVALFTVCIVEQCDVGGTVGVILNGEHLAGHAVLVALEVHNAVLALCAAALMPDGDAAGKVAARIFAHIGEQGSFGSSPGDLFKGRDGHASLAGSGGVDLANCHGVPPYWAMPSKSSMPLESPVSFT